MLLAKYIAHLDMRELALDAAPDAVTLRSIFATSLEPATPHLQLFCLWYCELRFFGGDDVQGNRITDVAILLEMLDKMLKIHRAI